MTRWAVRAALGLLLLVSSACGATVPDVPSLPAVSDPFDTVGIAGSETSSPTPAGDVRVAYPDEVASFLDLREDDATARDLQSLWGLPLFELDAAGALRPALVTGWSVSAEAARWTVDVELAPGTWSDGDPVTAADVVATVAALRDTDRATELTPLIAVEAVGESGVRLVFDRPYARWPFLLDGVGVLPASVLEEGGLDAYADAVPVSGGRFSLATRDPGRSLRFEANPSSLLGPPGVASVEVLVVPRFEAALALLSDGRAQVATGYLALNGAGRARELENLDAEDVPGGTWVALDWRRDGSGGPGSEARRSVRDAIDVTELVEGLLGGEAEVLDVPLPERAGRRDRATGVGTAPDLTVIIPRWQEAVSFTARALQRDLRSREADVSLISVGTPEFTGQSRLQGDAALRIFRTGPYPSLTRWLDDDAEVAVAADASLATGPDRDRALAAVAAQARVTPLYRPTVTNVWRAELQGYRPSGWPGVGFASARGWRLEGSDGS